MRVSVLALVLLTLGLVVATKAGAQAAETPREHAVSLFAQSVAAYREGRFDDAATLLEHAYALQPEPVLLYNLGRAREGAGADEAAADAYRRYLATEGTDATDASAARARLTVLDRRIEERHALEARAADHDARAPVAPAPEAASQPSAHEVAIAPWALAGGGAAALIGGGVLGGLVHDRSAALSSAPSQVAAVGAHSDAEVFAISADVLFGVGGLAVGIGVVWGIVELVSPSAPRAGARLRIGPSGMVVTF